MGIGKLLLYSVGVAQVAALAVPGRYRELFEAYPAQGRVDADLLRAIGWQESNLTPTVVSAPNANGTRDYGIMQINSVNLPALGLTTSSALDPAKNIPAARRLLLELDATAGNVMDLFSMYNAGAAEGGGPKRTAGGGYVNASYVRDTYARYLLIRLAHFAPVQAAA